MPVGKRIITDIERPSPELIQRFAQHGSADISDAMNMSGTLDRAIGPGYGPIKPICGPAVTVVVPTGAQNVRKMAYQSAREGDVIVVNGLGAVHYAILGGNIGRGLLHRGVAGMIIDGAFRDVSEFREMGFPVYARGIATTPSPKDGPGEVNVPIACGGVVVNPGDIIVADEDGIVVIPPARADEILAKLEKLVAGFEKAQPALLRGEVSNIANIEKSLRSEGFEIVDRPYGQG